MNFWGNNQKKRTLGAHNYIFVWRGKAKVSTCGGEFKVVSGRAHTAPMLTDDCSIPLQREDV